MSTPNQCGKKKLEYHKSCKVNPKCCIRPTELECAGDFNPPLLGVPSEFCKEALAKGLPIPDCTFAKPQKLTISTEPIPEETPPTHKYIKNWQKWCRVWKRNQVQLAIARQADTNPPVMTCGERVWYKKEDAELFERTLQMYYISGYTNKSVTRPEGLRPGQKDLDIQEKIFPKIFHIYPEMKRYRYAKRIREEMGLSVRCPSPRDMPVEEQDDNDRRGHNTKPGIDFAPTGRSYNWEKPWKASEFVRVTHRMHEKYLPETMGYRIPKPADLIIESPKVDDLFQKEGDSKSNHLSADIPQLTFSLEEQKQDQSKVDVDGDSPNKDYYNETRGPVLLVVAKRAEIRLSYKHPKPDDEYLHELSTEKQFFSEDLEVFSATTKGKETRHVCLKNGGTTAIRYQWLRFPPNDETRQMLGNPARYLALAECGKNIKKSELLQKKNNESKLVGKVHKPTSLEFRFKEGPSVLLPGQSLEFPIVYRSQKPGYHHETLYLLTHPKLCDEEGRTYSMRLTGICMDPDLTESDDDPFRSENVKEAVKQTTLEQEAADIVDAILDRSVFIEKQHTPTLPFGRVTTENIFYTHNKNFHYHYGVAEKSLQIVRNLVEFLVPKERMVHNENLCQLSIQSLYQQILSANNPRDLYWSHFKSPQTENLLKQLADSNNILNQPRRFLYPSKEMKVKMVCDTTIATFFDEIQMATKTIEEFYDTPELNHFYKEKVMHELQPQRASVEDEPGNNVEMLGNGMESLTEDQNNEEEEAIIDENEEEMVEGEDTEEEAEDTDVVGDTPTGKRKKKKSTSSKATNKEDQSDIVKEKGKKKDKRKTTASDDKKLETNAASPGRKGKKGLKGEGPQTKAKRDKSESLKEKSQFHHDDEEAGEMSDDEELKTGGPTDGQGNIRMSQLMLEELFEKETRVDQAKRIVFENLLASSIERMLCVLDSLKAMEDYRTSEFVLKPNSTEYCCDNN